MFVWPIYRSMVLNMTRNRLIRCVEKMRILGGFAAKIGEAALLADPENLQRLMDAFPEYFIEYEAN